MNTAKITIPLDRSPCCREPVCYVSHGIGRACSKCRRALLPIDFDAAMKEIALRPYRHTTPDAL